MRTLTDKVIIYQVPKFSGMLDQKGLLQKRLAPWIVVGLPEDQTDVGLEVN